MLNISSNYRKAVYALVRPIVARIHFTMDGVTNTYDDTSIINLNLLEEMNTLSNTLPANEVKVTLDNTNDDFNFLNLANMQEIIASRPKIAVEFGLVLADCLADSTVTNFDGKSTGDVFGNGNISKYSLGASLLSPSAFSTEANQTHYDGAKALDGSLYSASTLVNGSMRQVLFSFDVIKCLTDKFGEAIWQGKTTIADKVVIAKTYVEKLTCNWHGYGSSPSGNQISFSYWHNGNWTTAVSHTSANVTKLTRSTSASIIQSDGFIHYLAYTSNPSDGVTASAVRTDYIDLVIDTKAINVTEWVPMGTYFLMEWKSETAAMSISLVGRDNLDMLSQVSYSNTAGNTLYNLAVDVLQQAGINDYIIDSSLQSISTNGFKERLDSRTALQHIGVASRSAVYQDRLGKIVIKPFAVLDQSNNFLTFCGQAGGFAGGSFYPAVNNDFDMKNIVLDNIFQEPEISLDKAIYEVVVNIYEANGTREVVYINDSITGKNGASFKIDNPLINNESVAQSVAEWVIHESNYNAIYKTIWRQNPILECADVVLVEDSFNAKKQTRIVKQEFEYIGYLRGNTESRGGI